MWFERIEEAAAEHIAQRPAHRVDHAIERLLGLPNLLHTERVNLRVLDRNALPFEKRLRQQAAGAFRQGGPPGDPIVRRHVARARFAIAVEPRRLRAHPHHAVALGQELRCGETGEYVDTEFLSLGAEPADQLAQRRDEESAVVHRRWRRKTDLPTGGHEVYRFARHRPAEWEIVVGQLGEQVAQGAGIDHRARQRMLAQGLGFLEDADADVAQAAARFVVALDQARQLDRAGEPSRPRAYEQHIELDALASCGRRHDEPVERQRGLRRCGNDHFLTRKLNPNDSCPSKASAWAWYSAESVFAVGFMTKPVNSTRVPTVGLM